MATIESVLTKIRNLIAKVNNKTGRSDTTLTSAVDVLIGSYLPGGIIPSGTKTITTNGTHDVKSYTNAQVNVQTGITPSGVKTITVNGDHDVTEYATARVNVPASGITPSGSVSITSNGTYDVTNYARAVVNVPTGITPSGTKTITTNGTHDVTNFASALVNVSGFNAKIFTATISADTTSTATFITNDWIKSIRDNSNAFILLRYMGTAASTACVHTVLTANFPIGYGGATMYNSVVVRSTASAINFNGNSKGLNQNGGAQYNGHLNTDANGKLFAYGNATYPIKAGEYQIIAGTVEMA